MQIKQSVSWWCVDNRGVSTSDLLRAVKAIGYSGVELIAAEHFSLVRDLGLTIAAHTAQSGIDSGFNDPSQHDRLEREILASLDLATKYEIPNLIVFSGNRQEGVSEGEAAEHTAAGLRRVTKAAEEAGITLIVELLNSKVDHKGYQCDTSTWGIEVCKLVDSPRVKLLYDIYHMQIMEGDLIRTIETNHTYFGHYHTGGVPGRHDLDDTQEIYYPAVVRAIAATGYDGYLGHEFIPKGDPVAALEQAYRVCDVY